MDGQAELTWVVIYRPGGCVTAGGWRSRFRLFVFSFVFVLGWWRPVAATRFIRLTKLLYAGPG